MMTGRHLGSVVIPAHNEAEVIGRSLDALFSGVRPASLQVVVVCNGCSDDTAATARASRHPVQVIELAAASKTAALRAGDAAVTAFPRLYLDADVVFSGAAAVSVLERLRAGVPAARPPIHFDLRGASWPVQRYYRARSHVPAVMGSLWGAGVCGLSAAGRGRFADFPDIVADDLWLDRQFGPEEVEIVACAPVVVTVPRRTRDLMLILRRTYRGKAGVSQLPDAHADARPTLPSTLRDLGRLAAAGPATAIDAATYAAFAIGARLALALAPTGGGRRWERDDSSRIELR